MADTQYPLVPPELLQYTLLHETSLSDRTRPDSTSLLRFLSTPGHHYGEGCRRIFIGRHPDDDYEYVGEASAGPSGGNCATADLPQAGNRNGDGDDGSRTFLVGVQTLWELESREQRKIGKGKGRESSNLPSPSRHPVGNGHAIQPAESIYQNGDTSSGQVPNGNGDISHNSDDTNSSINASLGSNREDEQSSPATSVSKPHRRAFPWPSRKKPSSIDTKLTGKAKPASEAPSIDASSPDGLLNRFSSKDAKKKLSSGVSERRGPPPPEHDISDEDSTSIPQDVLSRRAQHSPKIIDGASSTAVFHDAHSFVTENGKRRTDREVSEDVKASALASFAPETEPDSAARHELLRRVSDTLVPETASDTFVMQSNKKLGLDPGRPEPIRFKSTKSVRWDISNAKHVVPGSRGKSMQAFAPGSGDQPAKNPSQVLSRPEPLEQPAEQVPDNIPPMAQLARASTSDSDRELARLADLKEASLPPGVEKLERMIIRACWTKQEIFPQEFDELAARKSALAWTPWEEMAVLWKKDRLEVYGTHRDPYHRFLTRKLALRYVIPLKRRLTSLSVYSVADQIFCLRCPPHPLGGRHLTGKAGTRNKRHVNSEGTNLFLFRARATTIAQDWYLGLHLALEKERLDTMEVYLGGLGVRIRLPTNAAAHDSASTNVAVSATRELMSAGLPDRNLVSKEEMLQSCKDLISNRQDWKELLDFIEGKGITLRMAWRKGMILDWLSIDRSVDGVRRIWDVYTGAIMKQAGEPVHRLEVLPEMHYPTLVNISSGVQLIEPPAIEGYVSRLRHRNENQRERLYLGTVGSALVIFKASRAKPPPFPHVGETHHRDEHHEDSEAFQEIRSATARHSQPEVVKEHVKSENTRLHNMLVRCKGVIRLRDVISVELDDSCQHCRRGAAVSEKKLAATLKTGDHEHIIVQLNLSDDRQFRFETSPKEAAKEWVGRLSSLVDYWKKREQDDAQVQVTLSSYNCVKKSSQNIREDMLPFQRREAENASTGTDVYEPLLSQAFHFCVQNGCHNNILMHGRLYHKKGHLDAFFSDRFILLLDNNLIIFETVKRNFSKRPVPLVHHRRLRTIRLRDVYVVTGESCSQYFRKTGQTTFNPSQDQNAFARIYKDGLVAVDGPLDCIFMLWSQRPSGTASKLGRNGKVHLFKARSKLERDQWVQAFNVMCEAYGRTTREREIRLATFGQIK